MQITYGVDANGTGSANYYVNASSVSDWSKVVSLHVSLLLRSQEDNLAPVAQTYQYNGAATTAADSRLRTVFNTTIALRNLLP
jgi:type IV pilus assembly protein PilW